MSYYFHRSTGLLCAVLLAGWWFLNRIELDAPRPVLVAKVLKQHQAINSLDQPRNTSVVSDLLLDVVDFPKGSELTHRTVGRLGFTDHFFIDASGKFELTEPQTLHFKVRSDDGFRLSIQGNTICEATQPQPLLTKDCQTALAAGVHGWKLQYFQASGGMGLRVRYSSDGGESYELLGKSTQGVRFLPLFKPR